MNKIKNYAIAILVITVVVLFGVIVNLKRTIALREYAIANHCEWIWQGTYYGDDRDYICK